MSRVTALLKGTGRLFVECGSIKPGAGEGREALKSVIWPPPGSVSPREGGTELSVRRGAEAGRRAAESGSAPSRHLPKRGEDDGGPPGLAQDGARPRLCSNEGRAMRTLDGHFPEPPGRVGPRPFAPSAHSWQRRRLVATGGLPRRRKSEPVLVPSPLSAPTETTRRNTRKHGSARD